MATSFISAVERDFIIRGAEQDRRADGRERLDYRHFVLETDVLAQASGSARLRLNETDVLVGIKAEIGSPDADREREGRIVCSVDCAPSAARNFEGRGADDVENELAVMLDKILVGSGAIDLNSLGLIPGRECWILYIDALVLDFGGNLADAVVLAAKAALHTLRIPAVTVVDVGEGQQSVEVSDDPDEFTKIKADNIPVCVTLSLLGDNYIVDAAPLEELCSHFSLYLAFNRSGNLCYMNKAGSGSATPSQLTSMIQGGKRIGLSLIKKLDSFLEEEQSSASKRSKAGFMAD